MVHLILLENILSFAINQNKWSSSNLFYNDISHFSMKKLRVQLKKEHTFCLGDENVVQRKIFFTNMVDLLTRKCLSWKKTLMDILKATKLKILVYSINRSNNRRCFIKKGVSENLAKFMKKRLCRSLFLVRSATLFKSDCSTGFFLWILPRLYENLFWRISGNGCFYIRQIKVWKNAPY